MFFCTSHKSRLRFCWIESPFSRLKFNRSATNEDDEMEVNVALPHFLFWWITRLIHYWIARRAPPALETCSTNHWSTIATQTSEKKKERNMHLNTFRSHDHRCLELVPYRPALEKQEVSTSMTRFRSLTWHLRHWKWRSSVSVVWVVP